MTEPRTDRDPALEPRSDQDPALDPDLLPVTVNPTGGGPIVPPTIVETDTPSVAPDAAETADPVKRASRNLPPGADYTEPTVVNSTTGDVLISEIQKETGVGGGTEPVPPGTLGVGGGATVDGSHPTLRTEAGTEAGEAMGALAPDTVVLLMAGPQQSENAAWWQVRAPDGRVGWLQEGVLHAKGS